MMISYFLAICFGQESKETSLYIYIRFSPAKNESGFEKKID